MKPIKTPKIIITKSGVIKASRIFTIGMAFALYVVADYIAAIINDTALITDFSYWCKTIINIVLITVVMLVVRNMRKDKRIADDIYINNIMSQIQKGYNKIIVKGLSSQLDEYLVELNKTNKYETFIKSVRARLTKIADKSKPKYIKERQYLSELLNLSKEEVVARNFRYKKITVSKLFSSLDGKILNDNEYDLDTYESRDIAKMIGFKALLVILFSAFSGMIITDFVFGGWSILYSTLIKIFSLLVAINSAMNVADDFVEHNIRISVQRRFKYLAGFVNSNPELRDIIKEVKDETTTEK